MFEEKIEKIIGKGDGAFSELKKKALTKEEIQKLNAEKVEQLKKKADTEDIVNKII